MKTYSIFEEVEFTINNSKLKGKIVDIGDFYNRYGLKAYNKIAVPSRKWYKVKVNNDFYSIVYSQIL